MHIALNNGAASFFVYPYGIRYLLAFLRLTFPLNAVNLLFQNRILRQGHSMLQRNRSPQSPHGFN